jgi:uncharacterized protein
MMANRVNVPEIRSMLTRDGVRLDADLYYPPSEVRGEVQGEYPVLLMRQPYGRSIASTVVYAHPSWYAAQGYIVVIQDVRGRGTSQGEFKLFESEIEDGEDAVTWAATLPHSNGKVGMYGFSYQGMTQIYAAMNRPKALKTICPAMLAYDFYQDWAYEGDVFRLQSNLGWALQLAAESARLQQDQTAFLALSQAAKQLPIAGEIPAYPEVLKTFASDSFYHDWISRERWDEHWSYPQMDLADEETPDRIPMLHIGGWFDPYLQGTLRLFQRNLAAGDAPQHLIIGPWAHLPWGRKVGAIDFGPDAVSDCDRSQVRWFDYWLKGEGQLDPTVTWFEMGTNRWVTGEASDAAQFLATRPPAPNSGGARDSQQVWRLETTGLTSMQDGRLLLVPAPPELGVGGLPDAIVHDPWRPVPSLGGHAASPAGIFDRAHLDDRSDVLTYTTEPLSSALLVQGVTSVHIDFQTHSKSVDLHVVLSQVLPDGKVLNITQGVRRVDDETKGVDLDREIDRSCVVSLQPTSIKLSAGNRLRVSVSLSNYPAYAMNSGTGNPLHEEPAINYQIITVYLTGGELLLPIAPDNAYSGGLS